MEGARADGEVGFSKNMQSDEVLSEATRQEWQKMENLRHSKKTGLNKAQTNMMKT